MKKINNIKILLILLMIFSITLVSCGKKDEKPSKKDDDDNQEVSVYPIGLDITVDKKEFELNEEFTSNVNATAKYNDGTTKDVTTDLVIDSTKYDKSKDGTYEIIISYKEGNITTKSFFLATVGTGKIDDSTTGNDKQDQSFGPGTYVLDASIELENVQQGMTIAQNTKFGNGFFTLKGENAKRANASSFAIELGKAESSWIEFDITGTATLTVETSSTGSENSSVIGIFDSENSLVENIEKITTVEGTTITTITYTLTTGTYRLLSQAGTSFSNRGVRVYKVTVVQV